MVDQGEARPLKEIVSTFRNPPASCRPHTRWWWMGNAASKEDITWQLEQMHEQGIGGVEQITMQEVYEKGNVPYLSREYFELVTHAIKEAKRLGMEFSLNFGGPGWVIGGSWVPPEDRSKNMVPTAMVVEGPVQYEGDLPTRVGEVPRTGEIPARDIGDGDRLLAVVAARVIDGVLQEGSLTDLATFVKGKRLRWRVPEGRWQLMAFWLVFTQQGHAIDHLDKEAMQRYCEHLGGRFREAFGEEFGKTVESFFIDSFEVALINNGIYWSDGLLEQFRAFKGYDLVRYLPAIWWEVGEISPKIRYDVNHFLHHAGLDAFFKPFLTWCGRNGVKGRIQPYGFTTDILEGAGLTHIPEMEITAGEKDAVPWFDTRIGPRKYVASGAHLYGRNVVSVEAYTYIHWETYRATLEELKIASDVFLRDGANKFYNHGYTCSPERDIAPSRRFESEVLINHQNIWWRYYRFLSDYVARCCYLLRQGSFVADVAVYLPLANQWTLDVRNSRSWTRGFDWGSLGRLLIANGYQFDLINDDVLLNHADMEDGVIRVGDLEYRVLLLPNVQAMPLETLELIQNWVRKGGMVIALERVPERSVGLDGWKRKDREVKRISNEMFDTPVWRANPTAPRDYGAGRTHHIRYVIDRSDVLEQHASALDPFLNILRQRVKPDLGIDFVREAMRENQGISHIHRKTGDKDIYFVTNAQDQAIEMRFAFRITGGKPMQWDPYTGEVRPVLEYEERDGVTLIRMRVAPYGSALIVFDRRMELYRHLTQTSFDRVQAVSKSSVHVSALTNGVHRLSLDDGTHRTMYVDGIPAPLLIDGNWRLTLRGCCDAGPPLSMRRLVSWTDDPKTMHFSGTGRYETDFELPPSYVQKDLQLELDLGMVGDIADVELNGIKAGVRWMRGQSLDITGAARPGRNSLAVEVTNTLINRVSGLKELPPVPEQLRSRYGDDLRLKTSSSRRLIGYTPLPNSGLLGPVTIRPSKLIEVSWQ